ncbi:Hpt domain-containing protein [Pseudobacteriovorax antillogorgiicola]|uniref:Hpt domain-containing protein n=2 Tax=Pseudobacteriovorax antillogorgiicola TaxID=1513793 RepID=A0A1Y6BJN6_9BACT|nr:Hpt domain-containing protein [Pseudobacteriovorax antillogorgiicola]SMF06625.1 Hpt domain-containing protein [Pseudobacteriovorax antillogorgiicola]
MSYKLMLTLLIMTSKAFSSEYDLAQMQQGDLLGRYLSIYQNSEDPLSSTKAFEIYRQGGFTRNHSDRPNFGASTDEYWAAIELVNGDEQRSIIIENDHGIIDYYDVYLIDASGIRSILEAGDQQAFSNRYLKIRTMNAQVILPPGKSTVLFRSQGESTNYLSLKVWDEAPYEEAMRWDFLLIGLLIGAHIVMIVYNAILAISMRDAVYWSYVVCVSLNLLLHISAINFGQFLGFHLFGFETYSNHIQLVLIDLIIISSIIFSWLFLDMKHSKFRSFTLLAKMICTVSLINIFVNNLWSVPLTSIMVMLSSAALIPLVVSLGLLRYFKEGYQPALVFLCAWGTYLLGSAGYLFVSLGVVESNAFFYWGQFVGGAAEVSLFSIALGIRFSYTKKKNASKIAALNEELNQINRGLEEKVQVRTQEVQDILTHIHQGIFTTSDGLTIDQKYSAYLETLLGCKALGGRALTDVLLNDSNLSSDQVDQLKTALSMALGEESLAFDINNHLLPDKLDFKNPEGRQLMMELDWNPLIKDDVVDRILVAIRDMTEKHEMQKQIDQKGREIELIRQLIDVKPERFSQFRKVFSDMMSAIDPIVEHQIITHDDIRSTFISYHTLKGVSRSLDLRQLSTVIHDAETLLVRWRDEGKAQDPEELRLAHQRIHDMFQEYIEINDHRLGRVVDHRFIQVSRELVLRVIEGVEALGRLPDVLDDDMLSLKKYYYKTPEDIVYEQLDSIRDIAEQLGKPLPKIHYVNHNFGLSPQAAEIFEKVLVHLIRNSLAHGLETGNERISRGKAERGEITISLSETSKVLTIHYCDDGRGISLKEIQERAQKLGVALPSHASHQEVVELLFTSGFSTQKEANNVAGRGVGLDAVRSFLNDISSAIGVELRSLPHYPDRFGLDFVMSFQSECYHRLASEGISQVGAA